MHKKFLYIFLGILFAIAGTALAVQITVPSAPSQGYLLQSTTTGAYLPVSLTAGSNVTISTTTSNITISSSGISFVGTTGQVNYFSGINTAIGTSTLFITTGSNVGLGTINPTEVNANARLTVAGISSQDIIASTTDNTTLSDAIMRVYAPGSSVFMGSHGTNQITTQYGITVGGWGEIGAVNSSFGTSNGLLVGTRTTNTPIVFGTNSLERMRILGNGNVGIGTTTPGTLFGLGNTGASTINLDPTATSTFGSGLNIRTGCYAVSGTCLSSGSTLVGTTGQTAYFSGTNTAVGTSTISISTASNVGIGVTNPGSLLQVGNITDTKSNIIRIQGNGVANAFEAYGNSNTDAYFYLGQDALYGMKVGYNQADDTLSFKGRNNGVERKLLYWLYNSNDAFFGGSFIMDGSINGTSDPTIYGRSSSGQGAINLFESGSGNVTYKSGYPTGSNVFYSGSGGTEQMRLNSSGFLGIGVGTPRSILTLKTGNSLGWDDGSGSNTTLTLSPSSLNGMQIGNGSGGTTATTSIASNLFTSTADATINTTSPTTAFASGVGVKVIPANSLVVGKKFNITGSGYYSTPALNTSTVTITTSIASTTTTTISTVTTGAFPATATNLPFTFNLLCTVRAIGASATLVCDGSFDYATALSGIAKTSNSLSTIGTITFDSTVAETLNVKANWSAVTTQTATVQQSGIDFMN